MNYSRKIYGPISKLSPSSFVPFTTYKVKGAKIIWRNDNLIKEYGLGSECDIDSWLLEEFAFSSLEHFSSNLASDKSTFFAERYGGQLIAGNGGGGRAGLKGLFQCKGIGPTPLVNQGGAPQYTIGIASLEEMINEALWGEVCNILLPFGAVRCLAVIDLDYLSDNMEKCAIAVRENEFRLAHFELSPYFLLNNTSELVSETTRVRASIESFPMCFQSVFGYYTDFESSMKIILERYAKQLSYAKFFRICHGSLTSSNIGMSGKYLDFGTISSLGAYENIVTSRGNIGFLNEQDNILESIVNFIDNHNWYSSDIDVSSDHFCSFFSESLNIHLRNNFLIALGLIKEDSDFDEEKANEIFKIIYRYLTIGGNKELKGVPYHNMGNCFFNLESLAKCMRNDPKKNGIESQLFHLVCDFIDTNSDFDMNNFHRKCDLISSNVFNLDFLHYDVVREKINSKLSHIDSHLHITNYINDVLSDTRKLRDIL